MFKVSFYSNDTITYNDKVTAVTLKGMLVLPNVDIPEEIYKWFYNHPLVETRAFSVRIKATGMAKKHPWETKDNPQLAKRIAESRAKIKIYRLMFKLLDKLCKHYSKLLYGEELYPTCIMKNTLYQERDKYLKFCIAEEDHLKRLINQS